jgi:predicted DCC family thiol-disulfide oxidoreductase YuxK
MNPATTCTVYFDSACPVCRREVAHYRRQCGADAITWVDAATCDEEALGPGLDRRTALGRFHVREADGALVSGAEAFIAIWRRLPALARLAPLASSRPMLALLDACYAVFLRMRRWWRLRRETACAPSTSSHPPNLDRGPTMTTRRQFSIALPAAALALAASRAASAQASRLEETDPQAVALGYRHDAGQVDARKFPTFAAGRNCANCQLYTGKPGDASGPCGAVGGKLVDAKGWCIAWVKRA